jgi:hypothetical protein
MVLPELSRSPVQQRVSLKLAMIPALFIIYAVSAAFWGVLGGLLGHHGQTTNM